jgi:hypothetical protein
MTGTTLTVILGNNMILILRAALLKQNINILIVSNSKYRK